MAVSIRRAYGHGRILAVGAVHPRGSGRPTAVAGEVQPMPVAAVLAQMGEVGDGMRRRGWEPGHRGPGDPLFGGPRPRGWLLLFVPVVQLVLVAALIGLVAWLLLRD